MSNNKKIFIAGGSGTIGIPLAKTLVADGHEVVALTRSPHKKQELQRLGASVAIADALDRAALIRAVADARPTHVIHQLTALPKDGPRKAAELDATNRLRIEGTRNLLDAAIQAGARRFLVGSFALLSPRVSGADTAADPAAKAVQSMETQVLEATRNRQIEGIILRYGLFYGVDAPSTVAMIEMVRKRRLPVVRGDNSQLPMIHLQDAVSATVRALDLAPAGAVYDIVDDEAVSMTELVTTIAKYTGSASPIVVPGWLPRLVAPYLARILAMRMPLSNAAAKEELGWRPVFPNMRDGLAHILRSAA